MFFQLNMCTTSRSSDARAQGMNRGFISISTFALLVLCVFCLLGCVGFIRETADYAKVQVDLPTKSAVFERFGEPVRKAKEGDRDVWYYILKNSGTSGKSAQKSTIGVMLFVVPLWHTTHYEDNAKFIFSGENLVQAYERVSGGSGFICGIQGAHGISPICSGGSNNKAEKEPDALTSPPKTVTAAELTSDVLSPAITVYLIPVEPYSFEFANELAHKLSKDLKLNVRASLPMGAKELSPLSGSSQFAADEIIERAHDVAVRLPNKSDRAIAIALTTLDINERSQALRFLFAKSNKFNHTSVISTARMLYPTPVATASQEQIKLRVYKMAKRAIGELYFGLARSSNIDDIMYAPIMSLEDIDAIGMDFKQARRNEP